MSLLELREVTKRGREGRRERVLLEHVTLSLDAGELAVVWGPNRPGCSALLRVAAGVEAPDSGTVRFDGRDLARDGEELRGVQIGYVQRSLRAAEGRSVLSLIAAGLLAHGLPPSRAHDGAHDALARTGATHCTNLAAGDLSEEETVRVALARTLALQPRLVIIDEPIAGVTLLQRDQILGLLRTLANEGTAVLAGTADASGLTGADHALSFEDGRLTTSTSELAPVLQLRRAKG
jgi:ABC-type multidrug transport system ATPase subunit